MKKIELTHYQKLTEFQKEVVDNLTNLGFKYNYFSSYQLPGWGSIDVSKFNKWSDLLKYVHEQGKDQKRFEIQRALGI